MPGFLFTICLQTGFFGAIIRRKPRKWGTGTLESWWPGDPGKPAWWFQDSTYFILRVSAAQA